MWMLGHVFIYFGTGEHSFSGEFAEKIDTTVIYVR